MVRTSCIYLFLAKLCQYRFSKFWNYSLTKYFLTIKSTITFPVGSTSLALISSGLKFSCVWYRRLGLSVSMIFFTITANSFTSWRLASIPWRNGPSLNAFYNSKLSWSAVGMSYFFIQASMFTNTDVFTGPGSSSVHLLTRQRKTVRNWNENCWHICVVKAHFECAEWCWMIRGKLNLRSWWAFFGCLLYNTKN